MLDSALPLPDARTLAFTDLGDPSGPAVFYFHGAPTSRLDLVALDGEFTARGVRVISPDRPGYGRSSPRPDRRIEDWPADVAALADALGIAQFATIGFSSGAPYSLACAAMLPRVVGAAAVSGNTDFGWAPAWDGSIEYEVAFMRAGDESATIAACAAAFGSDGSRFAEAAGELPAPDAALFEDPELGGALMTSMIEAFAQGVVGYAEDMRAQGQAWTFDPASITVRALVWHGEEDTLVPGSHARHTAEIVPDATLRMLPGHGHLSLATELPNLAAVLVEPLR